MITDQPSLPTSVYYSTKDGQTRIDYYSSRTMKRFTLFTDMSIVDAKKFIETLRIDAMLTALMEGIAEIKKG